MREQKSALQNTDKVMISLYLVLVFIGWISIYAAVYNEDHASIFDLSQSYGRQLLWIGASFFVAYMVLIFDGKFYAQFLYVIYNSVILLLIFSLLFARKSKCAEAWIHFSFFYLQTRDLPHFATQLVLA